MRTGRPESPSYQLFMLVLCVYTLVALAAEAVLNLDPESRLVLEYADTAICGLFFIDFLSCLRRAGDRWRYLYTWGWLDLASSIPAIDVARWGRAARVIRIIRVLRGVRATKILGRLVLERRAESAFLAASLVAILLIIVASFSVLQFEVTEDSNIRTAQDSIWWAFATITTVGYGDHYPVTPEGRFVAALLMCAGVGLFGTFSGFLAAWFLAPETDETEDEVKALRDEVRELRELLQEKLRTGV